ncbi:MAG: GNAT family N-acetyltransferase [Brevundimonas sp.]|uniref:GNAT family N-acetyltransferase n=1 Tax=Brevundimonas sp. TaxID=1871086 RepID=UPI0040349556
MSDPKAPEFVIRDATAGDMAAIAAIYAQDVTGGTGTFELDPPDVGEMIRRHATITALGLPWLVAEGGGGVAAYAYAGPFRTRPAYRYTVEDSIYVDAAHQGKGLGRALLVELIARCEALGLRQMLGVIGDSANAGSVALHAACGFEMVGTMTSVGWKFDEWRDVVFMQRALGPGGAATPDADGIPL